MTSSSLTALQWAGVPHVNDVDPVSGADDACLEEIRGVLAKHGKLNKFGIALLHYHFPLEEDEILVETIDPVLRTLFSAPTRMPQTERANLMETAWRFGENPGDIQVTMTCDTTSPFHPDWIEPKPKPVPTPSPGSVPPSPTTTPPVTPPSPTPSPSP